MLRWILTIAMAVGLMASLSSAAFAADPHTSTAGQGATAGQGQGDAHTDAHGAKAELLPDPGAKETWYHALWVVIIFLVLLAVLYPTAWKNVLAGLKAREARIREDIAAAERQRQQAEATLREYNARLAQAENQVRDMINNAVAQGEKAAAEVRMRATQEAEESRARAMREIEAARKQALSDIYEQAANLSTAIAEKIIRRNLNPDDQRELVRQSLDQFQAVQR